MYRHPEMAHGGRCRAPAWIHEPFHGDPRANPRDNVELEERLIHVRGQCGGFLPGKLPRPRPAFLNQILALLRVIQPLERLHVIPPLSALDHPPRPARPPPYPTPASTRPRACAHPPAPRPSAPPAAPPATPFTPPAPDVTTGRPDANASSTGKPK